MKTAEHIIETVDKLVRKYHTRDPYELCQLLGIKIHYYDLQKKLKGFFYYQSRQKNIVIDHNVNGILERILANLGMVLVDEFAGFHDSFIGIVNLDTATVRNTKQVLIVAVNKSDVLAVRVILIPHLRFPPLSNSMLNLVFPSSNTSI